MLARELMGTLADPIELRGERIYAHASVGIAVYPEDGRSSEALHAVSDAGMYASKHSRRRRDLRPAEKQATG
jgi:predicted signal transduction protein with EAL and GGDEF domain